ncbi:MAG TPA: CocE/NonD family hydrolase [Bryobacteraceae bacterium]|jgi:putative CocE/NonD family hydrolase|nr:CocE/NonD family hydrolase [Bryobacteraceae bacterium]
MKSRALLLWGTLAGVALAAGPYAVKTETGVEAVMRDGVVLRADIYRPAAEGQFPVLLQRTPYDKRGEADFGRDAAAHGFVVIIQDTRGRYTSEGEWYPFRYESNDGYDTVEWAAALPYSNGKVGMFGGSYVGATQMLTAIAHPPHLAGICPVVTASNYHDGWTYQGGVFEQWFNESWTSGLAQDTLHRLSEKNTNAMKGAWTLPLTAYPLFNFGQLPAKEELTASIAPYFLDWLAHPDYDSYWKRWSIEEHYGDIQVPALTIAAWYDIFQGGSLRNYVGMKAKGGSEAARKGQRLLVVIGGHAGSGEKIGDVDFGPAAADFDSPDVTLHWYQYLFQGAKNEFATEKPVKIFVMGANQWRQEDDWPLARAHSTQYFLHSAGKANSLRGDGKLSTAAPSAEQPDHYVYDPADPAPTVGGPLCCDSNHLEPGPRDQRSVEARDDVLVYSTPALARDMEVTGPVHLDLYAESSAVDTDFTAKLVDVAPDGFAQNLTEGIVRAKYRESQEKPTLMNPGETYHFTIDLWSTANVFRKGHKIRLEVSSSNFPRFARNLNTGAESAAASNFVSAKNTILHDANHPSALVLPVIPAE